MLQGVKCLRHLPLYGTQMILCHYSCTHILTHNQVPQCMRQQRYNQQLVRTLHNLTTLRSITDHENEKGLQTTGENLSKRKHNGGKDYVNTKGACVTAKAMGPGCGVRCKLHCKENILDDSRDILFTSYWQMGDPNQSRNYVMRYVSKKETTRNMITDRASR